MEQLRAAVVGAGHLGRFHARKYAALDRTRLAFVVDTNADTARRVAEETASTACVNHHDLIGKIDIASVVVPTSQHYRVARDLLMAGIHVLVEKPITTTEAEARELIELAHRNRCVLQVGHLERFNQVMQALASRVEAPLFIESHRIAPFKPRSMDTDVILDLMIHDIDLILELVRSPVDRIDASGCQVISPVIDMANARIRFANGCVANVTASRVSLTEKRSMRLFQQDTYFCADLAGKRLEIRRRSDREMYPGIPGIDSQILDLEDTDALESEIRDFAASVQDGRRPVVNGEDGLRALMMAMAVIAQVRQDLPHSPHEWRKHG